MDWKVLRLNKEVKAYDPDLFARRTPGGMIQICRLKNRWTAYEIDGAILQASSPDTQIILALTDNWVVTGKPVDRGLEPTMSRLREMDQWRDDSGYSQLVREREREEELKKRRIKNEMRARAYDVRRDFAKVTNDINTSSLD